MTPPPSRGRLRVGLLVDSLVQPAWVVEAVRQIIRDGIAEIVCVVVNEQGESPVPRKLPVLQRAGCSIRSGPSSRRRRSACGSSCAAIQ